MRYEIIFSPEAEADIAALKASDRAKALDRIVEILRIREKAEAMAWLAKFGRREE